MLSKKYFTSIKEKTIAIVYNCRHLINQNSSLFLYK